MRYKSQRLTELIGGVVLRPYVPHGTKWIGDGEGEILSSVVHTANMKIRPCVKGSLIRG